MSARTLKRFERHFLIGLVVLLLATFSVSTSLSFCEGGRSEGGADYGGTFEVAPETRVAVDKDEFHAAGRHYQAFLNATGIGSIEFADFTFGARPVSNVHAAWMHIVATRAAEAAGYRVGEKELDRAIATLVDRSARGATGRSPGAAYQEFLARVYRGGRQADFETTVEEVLRRDAYHLPLVRTAAYSGTYADAYEGWKSTRERVDLEFVALSGDPFADVVVQEERTRTAIAKQVARVEQSIGSFRKLRGWLQQATRVKTTDGAWPKDAEAFHVIAPAFKEGRDAKDAWGGAWRYTLAHDAARPDIRSPGENGEFGDADDVSLDALDVLETYGSLRRVGDAAIAWKQATGSWPDALARLLEKPGGDLVPPLRREQELQDGWERPLIWEVAEGSPPRLGSYGADALPNTADDQFVTVNESHFVVRPSADWALAIDLGLVDAAERPLELDMTDGDLWSIAVRGLGPDGLRDTADDVETGNEADIRGFYNQPLVRQSMRTTHKRHFEVLYVHLPMLGDEALRTLWARFPDQRPKTEREVFDYWKVHESALFNAVDPRDPQNGYGAVVWRRVAPDAPFAPVPDRSVFPVPVGGEGDVLPGEGTLVGEDLERFQKYMEKGWREIAIRDIFIERVLVELLRRIEARRAEVAAWDRQHAKPDEPKPPADEAGAAPANGEEADEADEGDEGDKPADEGDKPAEEGNKPDDQPAAGNGAGADEPRPEPRDLASLLATELAGLEPTPEAAAQGVIGFTHFDTKGPVADDTWQDHPGIGGMDLRLVLNRTEGKDQYAAVPAQIERRTTKAIVHNIDSLPARLPELEEVYDEVFKRYLGRRRLDRAERELDRLAAEIRVAEDDSPSEGFEKALATWGQSIAGGFARGRTGLFLGAGLPPQEPTPEGLEPDELARRERVNHVLRFGYDVVRKTDSLQDAGEAAPGSLGRRALRNDDTGEVLLVRVADRRYPSEAELSPARFTEWLRTRAYGPVEEMQRQRRRASLRDLEGDVRRMIGRFFDDVGWIEQAYSLDTNVPLVGLDPNAQ